MAPKKTRALTLMSYHTLKFLHIAGIVLLASGLAGVAVVSERMRRSEGLFTPGESIAYIGIFRRYLMLPGALLTAFSGVYLTLMLGFGFLGSPWIAGMWILFAAEMLNDMTFNEFRFKRLKSLISTPSRTETGVAREVKRPFLAFTEYLSPAFFTAALFIGSTRVQGWGGVIFIGALSLGASIALAEACRARGKCR